MMPTFALHSTSRRLRRQLQQLIQPPHRPDRILETIASCQCSLVEQQVAQIAESVYILFGVQLSERRMRAGASAPELLCDRLCMIVPI